jgi:hypothetical protein
MSKPPKVVCITERKRTLHTEPKGSIATGAEPIGTLHWERRSNRIDFFLSPLFGNRQRDTGQTDAPKPKLSVSPASSNESGE